MSNSIITKSALAVSLKKLATEMNFDRITVADITDLCGLNRQTFYYHFADKLELLFWIYDNEAFEITQDITIKNWGEKLTEFMILMRKDRLFYMNTIKCSNDYFEEYLLKILEGLFVRAIEDIDPKGEWNETQKHLVARFFSHGLCGVLIEWAMNGMKENEQRVSSTIYQLVEDVKKVAHMRYIEENNIFTK